MLHYKELGLVNSKELFKKAVKGGYAIPAFNFNNLEQLQAIIDRAAGVLLDRPGSELERDW